MFDAGIFTVCDGPLESIENVSLLSKLETSASLAYFGLGRGCRLLLLGMMDFLLNDGFFLVTKHQFVEISQ